MNRTVSSSTRTVDDQALADGVKRIAYPLAEGDESGYDPLLQMIGNARIVLIGEASHGTHEFYRDRALITRRLIEEMGFTFVAIEGDWPEAQAVNRFVKGEGNSAREVMNVFDVYPTWMWGNADALDFVSWLRRHNDGISDPDKKVGFYGLDLYSLYRSMQEVIAYLERVEPKAAEMARQRYACFEPFNGNKDVYAYQAGLGIMESCEEQAVAMLRQMLQQQAELKGSSSDAAFFNALMSAKVVRDGERYYRSMYRSDELSWNLRDTHMMETLTALLEHFGSAARAVVWEHNTHIGDFRATSDAYGMVNVGQLVREQYPGQSVAVGFGSYEGSVTASRSWGADPEFMRVPQARAGSYDAVFHLTELQRFLLLLQPLREQGKADGLSEWRGQRAIGVVYQPEYERGNYVPSKLAERYDAYIHIDRTRAVRPLNIPRHYLPADMGWDRETYPTGY